MSWLTRLLPYLEQQPLYDRALRDYARQPIFSVPPEGHANLATPVAVFTCPSGDRSTGRAYYPTLQPEPFPVAFTWYLGVSGTNSVDKDGVLFVNSAVRFADVRDGLSNTLLAGERAPSPDNRLGWWYAGVGMWHSGGGGDSFLGVRELRDAVILPMCAPSPTSFRPGRLDDMCDVVHFWSLHPGGANFAFADGSVRFLSYSADTILPALATRAGGEVVSID
jgi:prepilin-type processing-associated H-X9-DG protein